MSVGEKMAIGLILGFYAGVLLLSVALVVAVYGGIGYVIVHFIRKFW